MFRIKEKPQINTNFTTKRLNHFYSPKISYNQKLSFLDSNELV